MPSLNTRLLVAASITLMAFLGLTGLALDQAFQESAVDAVQERLQAQVYMLLGAADLDASARLVLPDTLPEARLSSPGSGLYADVIDGNGNSVWRSRSLLGLDIPLPGAGPPGKVRFQRTIAADGAPFFTLAFTVYWELEPEVYNRYTFRVAETQSGFDAQVSGFRRSLWGWLLAAALVLLAVQGAILRWSLRPLRRLARQVAEIEAGRRGELSGPYPQELRPLAESMNALIRHSHEHLERSRNALGDLAHSLKTPLAVLRSAVDGAAIADELRHAVRDQVTRMDRTVEYQLQRAAASGRIALAAPIAVEPVARKVMDSLAKVYAEKHPRIDLEVERRLVFYGEEGDLMEVLGNLADNACKWSRSRVRVHARSTAAASGRSDLVVEVEDDGPGIPPDKRGIILQRGERADPNTMGHGIGLAVVRDIVEEVYHGRLEIDSGSLGGARVCARLRF